MIIFVSSPYSGDVERNTELAQSYCRVVVEQGHTPIAPHLLFPQFLDEGSEWERAKGIGMGLQLLERCDELWVFSEELPPRISSGMAIEIQFADQKQIPVRYVTASVE